MCAVFDPKPGAITPLLLFSLSPFPPRLLSPLSVFHFSAAVVFTSGSRHFVGSLPPPATSAPAPARCVLLVPLDGQLEVRGFRFG